MSENVDSTMEFTNNDAMDAASEDVATLQTVIEAIDTKISSNIMSEKDDSAMEFTNSDALGAVSENVAPLEPKINVIHTIASEKRYHPFKNFVRNPKAQKWLSYEWFYSYIDKPLFESENNFQMCLRSKFPKLKTRKMTRLEWTVVRRILGKPRRFSHSFVQNERRQLHEQRKAIRSLQTRLSFDNTTVKDLPDEIPLPLSIGTRVTAQIIKPYFGLFLGTVDSIDLLSNTYQIKFDEEEIGTKVVPDYEVATHDSHQILSLSLLQQASPNSSFNLSDNYLLSDNDLPLDNGFLSDNNISIDNILLSDNGFSFDNELLSPRHAFEERDLLLEEFKNLEYPAEEYIESHLAVKALKKCCREIAEKMVENNNDDNSITNEKTLNLIINLATILLSSRLAIEKNDAAMKYATMKNLLECINEASEDIALIDLPKFEQYMQLHLYNVRNVFVMHHVDE